MKSIFLVDADDTILDFHGASAKALRFAFEQSGLTWKEEYLAEFRKVNGGLWEALERREITRAELMATRFHIFLKHLGYERFDGDAFNKVFLEHLATHPLYIDGAEDFLRTLGEIGEVYIVTNGTAWIQKSRFDISGLWGYAKDVFVSDVIGYDKPAKEYVDYVLSHIPNFEREKAVWIGDSLSADIRSAKVANVTGVWFNPQGKTAGGEAPPDYTARSFDEILSILQK